MFPATLVCPGGETRYRRFGDDVQAGALADMPCRTIETVKQVRAARAWQVTLGPVHEAVEDERVVRTKQLGHSYLLRHAGLADPLEDVVFGYLAAERQCAALRGNRLDLSPKRNLIVEKRVSGGTILSAFIGIAEVFHGCD